MKKIVLLLVLGLLIASSSFATDLSLRLTATSLSSGVSGVYFANNVAGDDATNYIISTGHSQGTVSYATGNFVSEIYSAANAGDKFASSDLITEVAYTSAALDGWAD